MTRFLGFLLRIKRQRYRFTWNYFNEKRSLNFFYAEERAATAVVNEGIVRYKILLKPYFNSET